MIKREFCAENFTHVPEAIELGIERIELCDNLAVGGTTPTDAVQLETIRYAHPRGVEVVSMIRPRGGSFVYSETEKSQMLEQAMQAIKNGSDGIVFGCLTEQGDIDKSFVETLIRISGSRQSVFHMAFDAISKEKQPEALDWLIEAGCTRLLTRGGTVGTALQHKAVINELIERAGSQMEILPGGGITHENLDEAKAEIHATQFHGTQIVPLTHIK
ncbi:copper homeostasis protein CutC [Alkalibacterium sp. f15]|uniref:copper homeostasis protein CutC n=1 Tax=Alkalibacterium sp. f15 TaxID=3414029 RepID=UPI003BF79693